MVRKNLLSVMIFITLMIALVLFCFNKVDKNEKRLKRNGTLGLASVINVEPVIKGDGLWVFYYFNIKDVVIKNKIRVFIESQYRDTVSKLLLKKHIPVIYDTTDFYNNMLLLSERDYVLYKQPLLNGTRKIILKIDSLKF